MAAYILRRILLMVPTLFGIMLLAFLIIQFAPGGPVERVIAQLSGTEVSATVKPAVRTRDRAIDVEDHVQSADRMIPILLGEAIARRLERVPQQPADRFDLMAGRIEVAIPAFLGRRSAGKRTLWSVLDRSAAAVRSEVISGA